jgi:hypothetical protein
MMDLVEADGFVVLLDENNHPVTQPEPCRFAWYEGHGRFSCHMLSRHEITVPEGGATSIAIVNDEGKLIYAHRSLSGPLESHQELIIEVDPEAV